MVRSWPLTTVDRKKENFKIQLDKKWDIRYIYLCKFYQSSFFFLILFLVFCFSFQKILRTKNKVQLKVRILLWRRSKRFLLLSRPLLHQSCISDNDLANVLKSQLNLRNYFNFQYVLLTNHMWLLFPWANNLWLHTF